MDNITEITYGPLPVDSPYVRPFRLYYTQNGIVKNWDLLKVHDSVVIIVFNTTKKTLVFVKQFRPAVYHQIVSATRTNSNEPIDFVKYPPSMGITIELCAGIVDKEKPWNEIAREEVLEECGYDVPVDRLEEIITFRAGVGTNGSVQKMYYCEVTDDDKSHAGGGIEDEIIEVIEFTIEETKKIFTQKGVINSPPSSLMGILWFMANKAPKYSLSKCTCVRVN